MKVAIITEAQAKDLMGQRYGSFATFYPMQDINDNWVISETEIQLTTRKPFLWVKDLEIIDYLPKIQE